MIALFDIGNTRIKWAQLDLETKAKDLSDLGRANHGSQMFEEITSLNWPQPEQIIASSVAADEDWQLFHDGCIEHWQQEPLRVISPAEGYGIRNAYAQPEDLGSDRWAALVGAYHLLHSNLCIIDCGTAMTVDFLDASGQHLGGYIIPGQSIMQQSLAHGTDAIRLVPQQKFAENSNEPGKSTDECVERGNLMAAAGLIEKSCQEMQQRTEKRFNCLFTGGDAERLMININEQGQFEPNLVLLGLAHIAAKNY